MSNLLEITDAMLASMTANPKFTDAFPFLATVRAQQQAKPTGKKGCGCRRPRMRVNVANYAELRRAIAKLPAPQKAQLKSLLGAKTVAIKYVPEGSSKVHMLKF